MNKTSGGDGIPVELFQTLKDDARKCCIQYASKIRKFTLAAGLERGSFLSSSKERTYQRMFNDSTIALISHASKVMLTILQASLQQ